MSLKKKKKPINFQSKHVKSILEPLSMIFATISVFPLASSSLAAVIQMRRSVGTFSRALLSTRRAFSYDSRRARASHSSTLVGQHSTDLLSRIRASSGSSSSTAAFHRRTELGTCSKACRKRRMINFDLISTSVNLGP